MVHNGKEIEGVDVPNGWSVVSIGEICELGRGRVISKKEIEENPGEYPVYSSQSKNKGCFGYISTYDFEGEYVTWTTDGVYAGTVFYRNGKFNCTNVCGTLKPKENSKVDMKYLSYQLGTQTERYVVRNGNPKLMNNIMAIIPVYLPPFSEQRKISEILFSVDNAIEVSEAIIAQTEKVKKGLMQQLLTKGIGHTKFKKTEIGEIPEEWKVRTLSEVSNFIDYRGKTPKKAESGIRLITAKNIRQGYINLEPQEFIPEEEFDSWMTRGIPKKGDVLITTEAPLGNVAQLNIDGRVAFAQRVIIIQPNPELDSTFLKYSLMSDKVQEILNLLSTGSTVKGIKSSNLKKVTIPIPSLVEQRKIANILSSVDEKILTEQLKLTQLQTLKKGLMQVLLTGKVRVKVDETEAVNA